jgi:hypothetical protein
LQIPFAWRAAPVALHYAEPGGPYLVLKPGYKEQPSPMPLVAGSWFRLAACPRGSKGYVAFASANGFLRRDRESVQDWIEWTRLLRHIAEPWGNLDSTQDLAFPPSGASAATALAHVHAADMRQQAIAHRDVHLGVGATDFAATPLTLAGYVAGEASRALIEQPTFRRCHHCAQWFSPSRKDQLFCLPGHRALAHREKE